MEIIKNLLSYEEHKKIKDIFFEDPNFSWFFVKGVASEYDQDFYFVHNFFRDNKINSGFFVPIILPILGKLNFNNLFRVKANCYTNQNIPMVNSFHIDDEKKHNVALYAVNSNNGYTEFEDGTKVESEENTLIIFDGKLNHRSVTQTNVDLRINININML